MNKDEVVKKNLDLFAEFMKYAFEHPEILEKIPPDGEIVILPENDQKLYNENLQTVKKIKREGKKVAIFKMELPQLSVPKFAESIK